MHFTREPIVETVITPKEGFKLVIRNSKGGGQEEFFVDAVEVISFGNTSFFRSLEKPKCFVVPVNDYEILEVREARMVLKTTSLEKGVKIGGGREATHKPKEKEVAIAEQLETEEDEISVPPTEQKMDKRRERRRFRKRKGKLEGEGEEVQQQTVVEAPLREAKHSLIPPPPTLISETLRRHKEAAIHNVEDERVEKEETAHDFEDDEEHFPQNESTEDEHIPF